MSSATAEDKNPTKRCYVGNKMFSTYSWKINVNVILSRFTI